MTHESFLFNANRSVLVCQTKLNLTKPYSKYALMF